MAQSPSIGIDLPLKFIVWQDDSGKVFIAFNSTDYLAHTIWRGTASHRCRTR
jgi:uncharacterized protein (DUF302 family)